MLKTKVHTDEIELQQLWDRLQEFDLDAEDSAMPFSARLARENDWSLLYAHRTIDEYKYYLFLCLAVGTPLRCLVPLLLQQVFWVNTRGCFEAVKRKVASGRSR